MLPINNRSIRTKIIILIVFVSTLNIGISLIVYLQYYKQQYYNEISQKLNILTRVIGDRNSATIVFSNTKDAKNNINSLRADKSIEQVNIILPNTDTFVSYTRNGKKGKIDFPLPIETDTVIFTKKYAVANAPAIFNNDTIAYIQINYSTSELNQRLKRHYQIFIIIILVSILFAFVLAYFAQGIITRPLFKLSSLINKISENNDFSIRSDNKSQDEIGQLSKGFNRMLMQIEKQNNDLQASKKIAESSLKAKEQFLANMTHELRTPLNSIIGISSLLEETELSNEQKTYIENVKLSSDHLLAIINDLLEFSKLGSGKLQLEKAEFNIRRSVERINSTMQYELKKRNLYFKYKIDPAIPHFIVGDDYRLNQILINLVGNAIKFTPKGGIEIEVLMIYETESDIELEFRVKDTGIGIIKEKQKVIFESFIQESSGTTKQYGGTGLGLSITKQLVELQNGKIRVESRKNNGSKFIFNIPYHKKTFENLNVKEKQEQNKPNNEKILLIDDNEMNLMFTKSILTKSNFIVETAKCATNALDIIEHTNFDLILMDLHMPKMDGYELTKRIRNNEHKETKNIPIIALTAAATTNEIKKCFTAGMNDYILKPFKKEDLISKILYLTPKK